MRRFAPFFLLLLLALAGTATLQAQVDLTGTWDLTWEGFRGETTTTFTFQQEGDTFTGTAQMQGRGGAPGGRGGVPREVEITDGKIQGNTITFSMAAGMGRRAMGFTFTGRVEGGTMEGTVTTPRNESPFTGVKK